MFISDHHGGKEDPTPSFTQLGPMLFLYSQEAWVGQDQTAMSSPQEREGEQQEAEVPRTGTDFLSALPKLVSHLL